VYTDSAMTAEVKNGTRNPICGATNTRNANTIVSGVLRMIST
jgi:hypothetical protein